MQTQIKQKLDFSGQNIYIGLNMHKKQITVTIMGEQLHHKTFSQPPDGDVLVNYLNRNFPGANYHAAYEASYSGFWLQERLQAKGVNCIVVHAADVPTKDKERTQKRDRLDSQKIARSLRSGELEAIHVPGKETQQDRSLLRARHQIVGNQTRCKNRIKALLSFFGVDYPEQFAHSGTHWSKRFMVWLRKVDLGASGNDTLAIYLSEAEFWRGTLTTVTKKITTLSRQEKYAPMVKLLLGVPGIGRLTAMMLLTELEDIKRFKGRDELCSYVGLVPNVYSSGDSEHVGNIIRRGNKTLKDCFIESAWVAARTDPALMMKYNQLCGRMNGNKAIIARMLLNRVRYVLINEIEYEFGVAA